MFSNGNIIIFFILLKYTSFMKFLSAENSTNITYVGHINNTNGIYNVTTEVPIVATGNDNKLLYKARQQQSQTGIPIKNNIIENNLIGSGHENGFIDKNIEESFETLPRPEPFSGGKQNSYQTRQQKILRQQQSPTATLNTGLPVFPERTDAVYFIVAVIGGAKLWGRTLARTLLDMGPPFGSPMGPPLRPLYLDLPANGRFSVKVLTSLCQQSDGIPLAGIVVIGDGQSARAIALSGTAISVPVLWAKGGTANIHGIQQEVQTSLQSLLQPSAREILGAVRALFLQTHWHSFFVLSDVDATIVLVSPEGSPLKEAPLQPKILPLPAANGDVFRQLAEISRSTRGIVLLLCNLVSARKIMSEAKRLNMAGGHFIWLWADTSSTTEFFDLHQSSHDDKIVEYPEAVKQFNAQNVDESDEELSKHFEDLAERKMDFEDLDSSRWNKADMKYSDKDKSRQNPEQQEQQIFHTPNVKQSNGAGRYIFGLKNNGGDSTEIKSNKEKRHKKDIIEDFDERIQLEKESGEDTIERNSDYETSEQFDRNDEKSFDQSDYVERSVDIVDNNSNYSWPTIFNETEPTVSRNVKLKRTSKYFEKNVTNSNVLFHHFNDFPVGLLALRPIKMPVDRSFIRSTIRLFASTWIKIEEEIAHAEDLHFHNRPRNQNPYATGESGNWPKHSRDRDRRRQDNLSKRNRNRRRRRRQIVHYTETVNRNHSIPVYVRTTSRELNNVENVSLSASSDLNDSLKNSSYNQNLSGLTSSDWSTNESNTFTSEPILNSKSKSKRDNTWWSVKNSSVKFKQPQQQQQQQYSGSVTNVSDRYRKGATYYKGGCFGSATKSDIRRADIFASALKKATAFALSGHKILNGNIEKPLTTNFELLNLVPDDNNRREKLFTDEIFDRRRGPRKPVRQLSKWRRVGLISGTNVHLDTIVWPGGDIVVSGMSSRARTVFRIVTALAPPFVMESELDEDRLCLRGLPCHRLDPTRQHNLTLMFNAIETQDRLREDAGEHGGQVPENDAGSYDHSLYQTKCCYGLSMDLLDNIATELGFEFHLYLVQDELFGTKYHNAHEWATHDEAEFTRRRQSHRKEKLQKHLYKDKFPSHYPPQLGQNYHSASFERKSNLNRNDNDEDGGGGGLYEYKEVTSDGWVGERHKQISKGGDNAGASRTADGNKRFKGKGQWNGIMGDLISGSADMSFSPLSVSRSRAEVIDFSAPYFYSGVSWLAAPQTKSEIPLLAFLLPFSPELWIAIFTSLNVTAIAVAIYEWLSPFGLNPWGRQRSKNFSMSSALWVMWGLLCGHLVAFKAPKSWPNKFLINVWGGFSVIFIASYTANIAALIAGLFFHHASNRPDIALLAQRVGAPTASAAESYIKQDQHLWEHMKKFKLKNIEDGIRGLKNGTLDLLLGDTPILDYYRATDPGCTLVRIGDSFVEDTYAIGMARGFPLKDSISAIIAKYSSNGYLDILTEKWYGELPCFKLHNDIVQPRPLGVEAVAGVFLLLGLGIILGVLILIFEHLFYKYTLPILRHKPKGTVWRSRNIMFFSQKLYRFINCVELVSPHHAARELVHTLRQGQIASLFQKSIKRKEDEQRRRRKSKAQFFEMIQEIRRVQQLERANPKLEVVTEVDGIAEESNIEPSHKPRASPKTRLFVNRKDNRSRSNSSTLNVRRFSTDSIISERLDTIGRRLSRDLTNSPPDFGKRFETFGKSNTEKKYDTFSVGKYLSQEKIEETKFDTYSGKDYEKPPLPTKKHLNKRTPLNSETFSNRDHDKSSTESFGVLSVLKEGLIHPVCQEDESKAMLRDRLHEELRAKYDIEKQNKPKTVTTGIYAQVQKSRSKDRPKEQQHLQQQQQQYHHRQRSLDGLETRPPMPIPTRSSQNDLDTMMDMQIPALPPKVSKEVDNKAGRKST